MTDRLNLQDGSLVLKGTTTGGKSYELTADVESVEIVVTSDYEPVFSWDSVEPQTRLNNEVCWIKLKRKEDGEAFRVQMETVDIERKARVEISENSLKAIDAARALCGAPDTASLWVGRDLSRLVASFTWTEKVVK